MANTRELRRRIKSVKNTAQITKAMQMVAATKMRRAQSQALSGRPYNQTLNFSLSRLLPNMHPEKHHFLRPNENGAIGILLLSTDKSLCGALNTNTFRSLANFLKEVKESIIVYTVGKKGRNYVVRTGKDLAADFENSDLVTFKQGQQIAKLLSEDFLSGKLKEVYLVYPDFVSTLRQEPKITKILPLDPDQLELETGDLSDKPTAAKTASTNFTSTSDFIFEPNVDSLLSFILVHFVETKIYQALLETKASEHSARMIAMQNATNNAKDLVDDLKLTYNQTRQSSITTELLEITSAAAALE